MVKLNYPKKLQLSLKIQKEKYFMHQTLYIVIPRKTKKLLNLDLIGTLFTNTGLTLNTLTANIGLACFHGYRTVLCFILHKVYNIILILYRILLIYCIVLFCTYK